LLAATPAGSNRGSSNNSSSSSSSSNSAAASQQEASDGPQTFCGALHGDMLGDDVLVTPYGGRCARGAVRRRLCPGRNPFDCTVRTFVC
jgi:hypothetical protein